MKQKKSRLLMTARRFFAMAMFACIGLVLNAQDKTVSGTINDVTGTPVIGASVTIKGKTVGTVTDINGKYSLKAKEGDVLVFSFMGYKSQEATVGGVETIDALLEEDVQQLNEVVVIGYGVQKKSDLTGAVASVSAKDLKNMPVARVDEALQGKAAGVQIYQNSGQPGSEPKIRVRGIGTVNGGNPLVVIDGVSGGSLSSLNPSDIESMEILKDAASQAIYGSAGANGVILVTTKRGKADSFHANLDMFWGSQQPWSTDNVKVADAQQYAEIYNINKPNFFKYNTATGQYLNNDSITPITNTKWSEKIFRSSALMQNYNLSVNKGWKKANFYTSIGYNGEDGTLQKTYNKKYTFRLNSDYQIVKRVKVGESFNYSQSTSSSQGEHNEYGSPLSTAIQMLPIVPVHVADGSGNFAFKGSDLASNVTNPLAQIEYNDNVNVTKSLFGDVFLKLNILEGFNFETHYGINSNNSLYRGFAPSFTIGESDDASASQSVALNTYQKNSYESHGWQYQSFFTYDLNLSEINKFAFVAGFESGYSQITVLNKRAAGFDLGSTSWENYNDTTLKAVNPENVKEIKGYAYFGRVNYDLANILLLQGNIRRDYSSKFGPNKRGGTFPAVSAGIKFSEFDFVKDLNIIDFGKIRVGYGETGNSDIQPYLYNSTYGKIPMNSYAFGSVTQSGAALLTAGNPDLHWEKVVTQNIGLDFGLIKNRLSLSFDYFTRKNKDMLLRKSVPTIVGYITSDVGNELGDATLDTRPLVNYGTLDNKGYEITIGYKDKIGDLNFDLNANITHTETTIDDIGDPLLAGSGRGLSNVCQTKNGDVVSAFYGYKTNGIYKDADFVWYKDDQNLWKRVVPNENGGLTVNGTDAAGNAVSYKTMSTSAKPGFFKYVDSDGNGIINVKDMTNIGDPNPKFTYGFSANFDYKGIDLSMFFQGSKGNKIFNMLKVNLYSVNNGGLNWSPELKDHYIPAKYSTSKKNINPVVTSEARNIESNEASMDADLSSSDFYVEDGSYLRLKNIQLGYTLPSSVTRKFKIEKCRIYIGAKNLLTFTNYTGFDPEVGENTGSSNSILEKGFDRGTYPQSKMFLLGMNFSF